MVIYRVDDMSLSSNIFEVLVTSYTDVPSSEAIPEVTGDWRNGCPLGRFLISRPAEFESLTFKCSKKDEVAGEKANLKVHVW